MKRSISVLLHDRDTKKGGKNKARQNNKSILSVQHFHDHYSENNSGNVERVLREPFNIHLKCFHPTNIQIYNSFVQSVCIYMVLKNICLAKNSRNRQLKVRSIENPRMLKIPTTFSMPSAVRPSLKQSCLCVSLYFAHILSLMPDSIIFLMLKLEF